MSELALCYLAVSLVMLMAIELGAASGSKSFQPEDPWFRLACHVGVWLWPLFFWVLIIGRLKRYDG